MTLVTDIIASGVRIASSIGFASLGETFSQRAGVMNIGLEGYMLISAFAGVVGSEQFQSPWLGLLTAVVAGTTVALIHAIVSVTLRGDQIISGIALNLIALGGTTFFFSLSGANPADTVPGFHAVRIPLLADIPIVGEALFNQTVVVYLLYALVAVGPILLYHTSWGLKVRAAGENPAALEAAGPNVLQTRYQCILLAGALAGLGGGYLALSQLHFFVLNVTGGRGFIALAAVIFGNWSPLKVALAAGVFGIVDALQLRLQASGVPIPSEATTMLPYVFSIAVLAGFAARSRMPSFLTVPYAREQA